MDDKKPKPDFTMDEFLDELVEEAFPVTRHAPMYYGPGASTTREVAKKTGYSRSHTYRVMQDRADAENPTIVKVRVWREGKRKPLVAWVRKEVYDQHAGATPEVNLG